MRDGGAKVHVAEMALPVWMADSCPLCGAALRRGAFVCPDCGARIELEAGPVDQLLVGLDDLSRTADAELARSAEDQVRAANEALGELEEVQEGLAGTDGRAAGDGADLAGFVRRVQASDMTRDLAGLASPPPRNGWASPIVAVGALLAAMGVFLLASEPYVGAIALLAGAATMGMGSVLYRFRPVAQ